MPTTKTKVAKTAPQVTSKATKESPKPKRRQAIAPHVSKVRAVATPQFTPTRPSQIDPDWLKSLKSEHKARTAVKYTAKHIAMAVVLTASVVTNLALVVALVVR